MTAGGQRRTLGRYELLEPIGRGSATEAFRAKSFGVEGFEKVLVIKRVLPEFAALPTFLERFRDHVQRAMRLSHANLAQIFDFGRVEEVAGASYFLATEYVSGLDVATLLERCQANGMRLPLAVATYLALEVGKALDHAHRRKDEQLRPLGIVHGAVAPHNVLVSFDGDVKLTDFGLVRALLTLPAPRESLIRSYAVLSPEQARGGDPTVASDVFSLGAFLYTALSGSPPFVGASAAEVLGAAAEGQMRPLSSVREDVPATLAELTHRALAYDPEDRFPSISSMYEELLACVYASGLRALLGEVAVFVDQHREAPATIPSEGIDVLLARPLTVPPEVRPSEPGPAEASTASVPPLTGFGEMRHVSTVALVLRQDGALPDALVDRMRAAFDRYGGTVLHEGPGEVTAIFGLDRSDGRDTEIAVRCGLVLVRGLDVGDVAPSVGINAGRIRHVQGEPPLQDARTERLVSSAMGLASDVARVVRIPRRLAPSLHGRFPLEPLGSAYRVTEFAQDGFGDGFVGRRVELQQLGETLVGAARGALRIVRIVGEPGIGKTRLAVEMQRRLSRGSIDLQTYIATCPPRGRDLPDSGILAMLRRVCGVHDGDSRAHVEALEPRLRALGLDRDATEVVLAELGAATASQRLSVGAVLRSAVLRMMHSLAEDRFTVFIWDDAHELDATSADLLTRASTRLANSRIALVVCARPDVEAPVFALPVHAELGLTEMDAADIERLVGFRLGVERPPDALLEFLSARAGGQPMFVEELLGQVEDRGALRVEDGRIVTLSLEDGVEIPRTLRALTGDRLRRVSDDERHLFVAAAVLDPPVAVELLARMVDLPVHAVDQIAESLVKRGLFRRDGVSALGFPSLLAREVVLSELDAEDLANLHRRAASAHVALLGRRLDEEADRVGYHLAAAGDRDAAADFYARGGLYALSARKLERAALDLGYALDLTDLEARSASQTGNWLRALSTAVRHVRTGPSLPSLVERLTERALRDGVAPVLRAYMRIDLACILGSLDQQLAAEGLLERGASEVLDDADVVTAYLSTHAELTSARGEFRLARRSLDLLVRTSVTDKSELHRITLSLVRTLGATGKIDAARTALEDAEALAPREDPFLSLDRSAVRTALCENAGRWREAAESSVQAASQAEELGLIYEVASSLSDQAVALARLGDTGRARAAVASAFAAAEEAGTERVLLRCRLVQTYLDSISGRMSLEAERGDVALAESRGWIRDALLGRFLLGRASAETFAVDVARRELLLGSRIAASTGNHAFGDQFAFELNKL